MNILINASNLAKGGGLQVTDSICCNLISYPQHHFIVVLCPGMDTTRDRIKTYPNVRFFEYAFPPKDWKSLLGGRNSFLDALVRDYSVNCVLSVFGPITWRPRCPHVCGFAIPHLVIPESPYFKKLSFKESCRFKIWKWFNVFKFRHGTKYLYTENPFISQRVGRMVPGSEVRTITNTYNQIFDMVDSQQYRQLPAFDGTTILTVSAAYPHKNLEIAVDILKIWKERYPNNHIRFVFTIDSSELPEISPEIRNCILTIGRVNIAEVPSLYEQCDIVMQPSLLECFSAVYVEAMRTKRPLLTPDLIFAKGICGKAALYYEAKSAMDAADKIYMLLSNEGLCSQLIEEGSRQLKCFDSNQSRIEKLISFCEEITTQKITNIK